MKKLIKLVTILFLVCCIQTAYAQEYIDLLKINQTNIRNSNFSETPAKNDIDLFELNLILPIPLSKKTAIITGVDYTTDNVVFFPEGNDISLRSLVFKLGLNIKHSDKWTGFYILQPKISSQGLVTSNDSFFIGGLAIVNYKVSERLTWRFGGIASSEAFGTLVSPIAGIYYQSKNKKWELDAYLPGRVQLNYKLSPVTSTGFFFQGLVRSFALNKQLDLETYAESSRTEIGPYVELGLLKNQLLFRLQGGYSTVRYEVFEEGDLLPFRLSAIEFNDTRNRLNPEDMSGAFFVRFGATFRLFLNNK